VGHKTVTVITSMIMESVKLKVKNLKKFERNSKTEKLQEKITYHMNSKNTQRKIIK
jgi:hypothetical protein